MASGDNLYVNSWWKGTGSAAAPWGVSLRLLAGDGAIWAQHDEQPLGSRLTRPAWPDGIWLPAPLVLPVPDGTPPGDYTLQLVAYDSGSGRPFAPVCPAALACDSGSVRLGMITVAAAAPGPLRPQLARFGPLALVEAHTPAGVVSAGDAIPLELLWQAIDPPGEPLVIVVQLLDGGGKVAAGVEEPPNAGRSPGTESWGARELARDRHTLTVPAGLSPGEYRLIVGVYRASDRVRITGPSGLLGGGAEHFVVKTLRVR